MTKIIAHRGAWKEFHFPENSLASLKKAIEIGCYGSEFDVQKTKDNQLIVFHDSYINNQPIEYLNYQDLKEILLSNGECIPTLDDFFLIAKNQLVTKLILEIKSSVFSLNETIKTVELVIEKINEFKLFPNQVEFILFSWEASIHLKKKLNNFNVYYLEGNKSVNDIIEVGLNGIDYHYSIYQSNNNIIEECKINKLFTNSWTVNKIEIANNFIKRGIDFITTDFPNEFLQIPNQYKTKE